MSVVRQAVMQRLHSASGDGRVAMPIELELAALRHPAQCTTAGEPRTSDVGERRACRLPACVVVR